MEKAEIERFKKVAVLGLKEYDLNYDSIEFLTEETNVFFEVKGKDHFVLKIFQEESSKLEDNLIEAFTLDQISNKTNIVVPTIIKSRNDQQIVFVESTDFDTVKRVAVYKYVEGKNFDGLETLPLFERLGEVTAIIHKASKTIVIPSHLEPKKWNQVFYYRDEEAVYHKKEYSKYFSDEDKALLDAFIKYLNKMLPKYYVEKPFLIHADLNPWNIKLHNGEIRLLDFEEGIVGNAIHDIAIMLFYYRYDPNVNYNDIKKAYFEGYRKILDLEDLSDFDIELLIMARITNFINYDLLVDKDPLEYIQENIKKIKDFIKLYKIDLAMKI